MCMSRGWAPREHQLAVQAGVATPPILNELALLNPMTLQRLSNHSTELAPRIHRFFT